MHTSFPSLLGSLVASNPSEIDPAATAWILVASAMVVLMTGGLAFFYGGLVRSKSVLNTMMMSFGSFGVVGVVWAVVGYSLAFAPGNSLVGDLQFALLDGVDMNSKGDLPHLLFMAFQGTFAIITAALISGAVVERMRFKAYLVFIGAWVILVYSPVCHWVWGNGWLAQDGALDFAGGTVVHINAAAAAAVAAIVLGPRRDYGEQALIPHNVPFVLLGSGLLWFGWFGFNAGSALAANGVAGLAFANTLLAPSAAVLGWMILELVRTGRPTAVGVATAIVVGLVAITPAAGFVSPISALVIGAVAVVPSYFAIEWRTRSRFDDSLDVVAAHGLGGLVGALLTGVFAQEAWGGSNGLLFGDSSQVTKQLVAIVATIAWSGVVSFGLLKLIGLVTPLRASTGDESVGLDVKLHGEEAYADGEGAILVSPDLATVAASASTPVTADKPA